MQHIKLIFKVDDPAITDMLIAQLSEAGYDGFEETGKELYAYIPEGQYSAESIKPIADAVGLDFETETIPEQNWNALWESNFDPVVIEGLCTIRADFHDIKVTTPHEIIINPKMAFGTGHHATTHLMMVALAGQAPQGKTVLDFGTGTGVLAILAEMLGASRVVAIDNDEWAVTNAQENAAHNGCSKIEVLAGSLEQVPAAVYELILANINRHILLQYMEQLYSRLAEGGTILMSGLQEDDEAVIVPAAQEAGFQPGEVMKRNGWILIPFTK